MANNDLLSLNKNLSYQYVIPNNYQVIEKNPINFFSPTNYSKLIKLPPNNTTNLNSNIYPQNYYKLQNINKKTLILDLDETLVHSSIIPFPNGSHIIITITVAGRKYDIYVLQRPFVDQFLQEMSSLYEIIIFTASMAEYAEPLLLQLDKKKIIKLILNRTHCIYYQGKYIKDLKIIKKDIKDLIIIDNNPVSYSLNKENGIPILSWFDNPNDGELMKLIPILKYLAKVNDVRPIINQIVNRNTEKLDFNIIERILNRGTIINNNLNILTNQNINNNTNINNGSSI